MAFSDTILLPKKFQVPDNVIFYKRIDDEREIMGKKIGVYSKDAEPYIQTVMDCRVYPEFFLCELITGGVDTNKNAIAEVDIVHETLQINLNKNIVQYITDDAENRLIQEMRRHPSLAKRIPKELWEHPSFKRKIDVERTKGRLKSTNYTGLFVHDKLPHGPLSEIHDMLGLKPHDRESREKRHRPPPPPLRRSATCTGSNCSISGGTRKRRFKK